MWTFNVYYKAVASWLRRLHNQASKAHHVFEQIVNVKNKAYFEAHNTKTKTQYVCNNEFVTLINVIPRTCV